MDADTFRWIFASLAGAIFTLIGMLWRDVVRRLAKVQETARKIDRNVLIDLRGLEFRIGRLEAHAGLPPLINRRMESDDDTIS